MSEESLAAYVDRVMPSWWKNPDAIPSWWNGPEPPLDPVLVERFAYYFRRGLELVDAVPRDDPFWDKTNTKATDFKAGIWFRQVLEANPGDIEARWILAALGMTSYTRRGVIALLAPLVAESPSTLRWLVDVTVYTWLTSGADHTSMLREQLRTLQNVPAVRSLLEGPRRK